MNSKPTKPKKFNNNFSPSIPDNSFFFVGKGSAVWSARVFYFGLTPFDIKPVNHQSLSAPYVLAGG